MRRLLALLLLVPLAAGAVPNAAPPRAAPAPRPLALDVTPTCCAITFTAYAFGVFPIAGSFGRFEGRLVYDPGDRAAAHAEARISADSLNLDAGPIEADVKAQHFLDVDHFPLILFAAAAIPGEDGAMLQGMLTIKGVTRPVTLTITERDGRVTAEAMISRRAFGITARPVLAGDTITITVNAPLPR
ncbi:YceI family protein [Elioraea sp.]|uniref:YceI family protein n=1 Tax=Elioraea sp. TaxID=2185103 RepID=UPI0025BD7E73|nr:YceI family protein [Elioraea sp.]